jgi:hypothetical protein
MGENVVSAFFANRSNAARVLEQLASFGVDQEEVSILDRDPPSVRELGVRHPAEPLGVKATDAVTGRLARSGTLVMADLGFAMAGPLVEVLAEGRVAPGAHPTQVDRGIIVGALTHLGLPEYEAMYLDEAVRRGGTVLVMRTGSDPDSLRRFLDECGGRKLHEAHEQPPVLRA